MLSVFVKKRQKTQLKTIYFSYSKYIIYNKFMQFRVLLKSPKSQKSKEVCFLILEALRVLIEDIRIFVEDLRNIICDLGFSFWKPLVARASSTSFWTIINTFQIYTVRDPGSYARPERFPCPRLNTTRQNDIRRHKSIRPTIKDN